MRRIAAGLALALASAFPAVAAGGGIYLWTDSIKGPVMTRDHAHWIDILAVEVGGQTVSSQAPYALYLPGPIKQIVVTKRPDSTSGAFSAAFASPTEVRGMQIDIVHPNLDSRGAPVGPQHSGLTVGDMWIASFKSTGATETIVFTKEKPVRTPASQEFGRRQSVATPAPEGRKR